MLNNYEKNRQALAQFHPGLGERLDSIPDPIPSLLVQVQGELWDYALKEGSLAYKADPAVETERFWQDQPIKNPAFISFYGWGLGHVVYDFVTHHAASTRFILVIEKDLTLFKQSLRCQDYTALFADPRIHWLIGQSPKELERGFLHFFSGFDALTLSLVIENKMWMPAIRQDGSYYVEASKALALGRDAALINMIGDPEDSLRGLFNFTDNLPLLAEQPLLEIWHHLFEGHTGVVVSTGPSLQTSIEALKQVNNRALIVAVDSAVPALLKHGIKPHLVTCLERVVATRRLMEILPPMNDTFLVASPLVYPETLKTYQGPKVFFPVPGLRLGWMGLNIHSEITGFSASTMAVKLCHFLGCHRIILLGQDLAFDPQTFKSHVQEAHAYIRQVGDKWAQEAKEVPSNWVLGNSGEPILTFEPFKLIASSLTQMIHRYGLEVYNAIPQSYGMKIEGTTQIDPSYLGSYMTGPSTDYQAILHQHYLKKTSAFGTLSEMATCVEKAVEQLALIEAAALDIQHHISCFYHQHLPTYDTQALREMYDEWFQTLQQQAESFFEKQPLLKDLMWPFIHYAYVLLNMNRHQVMANSQGRDKIKQMIHLYSDWLKHLQLWSCRLQHMFSSASKKWNQKGI